MGIVDLLLNHSINVGWPGSSACVYQGAPFFLFVNTNVQSLSKILRQMEIVREFYLLYRRSWYQ